MKKHISILLFIIAYLPSLVFANIIDDSMRFLVNVSQDDSMPVLTSAFSEKGVHSLMNKAREFFSIISESQVIEITPIIEPVVLSGNEQGVQLVLDGVTQDATKYLEWLKFIKDGTVQIGGVAFDCMSTFKDLIGIKNVALATAVVGAGYVLRQFPTPRDLDRKGDELKKNVQADVEVLKKLIGEGVSELNGSIDAVTNVLTKLASDIGDGEKKEEKRHADTMTKLKILEGKVENVTAVVDENKKELQILSKNASAHRRRERSVYRNLTNFTKNVATGTNFSGDLHRQNTELHKLCESMERRAIDMQKISEKLNSGSSGSGGSNPICDFPLID